MRSSEIVKVGGASANPTFVYESFARSRSRPASAIEPWSNAASGDRRDGMPGRVLGDLGVDVRRNEAEERRRHHPVVGNAVGLAARLELLQVRELLHVDLCGQVAADGVLERLAGIEVAAGERPGAAERIAGPLPQQNLELVAAHLEHDRERLLAGPIVCGKLRHRFSLVSRKLPWRIDS